MSNFAIINKSTLIVENVIVADDKKIVVEFYPDEIIVDLTDVPEVGIDWKYDTKTKSFSRE